MNNLQQTIDLKKLAYFAHYLKKKWVHLSTFPESQVIARMCAHYLSIECLYYSPVNHTGSFTSGLLACFNITQVYSLTQVKATLVCTVHKNIHNNNTQLKS